MEKQPIKAQYTSVEFPHANTRINCLLSKISLGQPKDIKYKWTAEKLMDSKRQKSQLMLIPNESLI